VPPAELPPGNLVFLIDVSGSMSSPDKLPLLKAAFKLLARELRPEDRVAIVVYAGRAGVVLEPTAGSEKEKIVAAIDSLKAGGSTAGGAGIRLAYEVAKENFRKDGNNRVILATDGDFNVGVSSEGELTRLIEERRDDGIFLSVLGFGMGNIKDNKMEALADKGNGMYAYIDGAQEAEKVLVGQLAGTLYTIAKDVKLQVEFNPAKVREYRLIGYENRVMDRRDFSDDKKDAGDMGAGHTVTVLYEVVPADAKDAGAPAEPLVYQRPVLVASDDLLQVKIATRCRRRARAGCWCRRWAAGRRPGRRIISASRRRWPSTRCCCAIRSIRARRATVRHWRWRRARGAPTGKGTGRSSCGWWR
jgi:Ca-activated chloride channel family protein